MRQATHSLKVATIKRGLRWMVAPVAMQYEYFFLKFCGQEDNIQTAFALNRRPWYSFQKLLMPLII